MIELVSSIRNDLSPSVSAQVFAKVPVEIKLVEGSGAIVVSTHDGACEPVYLDAGDIILVEIIAGDPSAVHHRQ